MKRKQFHGSAVCAALFVGLTAATADIAPPTDPSDTPEELRGVLTRLHWRTADVHPSWSQTEYRTSVVSQSIMPTRPVPDTAVPLAILVDDRVRRLDPRIDNFGARSIITEAGTVDTAAVAYFVEAVRGAVGPDSLTVQALDPGVVDPDPMTPVPAPAGAIALAGLLAARRRRA